MVSMRYFREVLLGSHLNAMCAGSAMFTNVGRPALPASSLLSDATNTSSGAKSIGSFSAKPRNAVSVGISLRKPIKQQFYLFQDRSQTEELVGSGAGNRSRC